MSDWNPCINPPDIGSTIWVMTREYDKTQELFSSVVVDVSDKQSRQGKEYYCVKLRGFRDKDSEEWSLPQGPYGFYGEYFTNEIECREAYLKHLRKEVRRIKRALQKLNNKICEEMTYLQKAWIKACE